MRGPDAQVGVVAARSRAAGGMTDADVITQVAAAWRMVTLLREGDAASARAYGRKASLLGSWPPLPGAWHYRSAQRFAA